MLKKLIVATDFSKHATWALKRAEFLAKSHKAALHVLHVMTSPYLGSYMQPSIKEVSPEYYVEQKRVEDKLQSLLLKYPYKKATITLLAGRPVNEITQFAKKEHVNLTVIGAHGRYYINDYVLGTIPQGILRQTYTPVLIVKNNATKEYKRILIATDFSKVSKDAIEFAYNCFPEAKITLLHIVDIYYREYFNPVDSEAQIAPAPAEVKILKNKFDDFVDSLKVDSKNFTKKIIAGYPADAIVEEIHRLKANLIVFGAQGKNQLHYFLLGSVAKRILQLSPIDMLAVPKKRK